MGWGGLGGVGRGEISGLLWRGLSVWGLGDRLKIAGAREREGNVQSWG